MDYDSLDPNLRELAKCHAIERKSNNMNVSFFLVEFENVKTRNRDQHLVEWLVLYNRYITKLRNKFLISQFVQGKQY